MGRFTITTPFYNTKTGRALPFSRLFFFENNTITPKDTFSDPLNINPNPNPVVADGSGQFGDIFLQDTPYSVELRDRNNVTQWRRNNVLPQNNLVPSDVIIEEEETLADGQTVVTFTEVNANLASFYIVGQNVDQGRLKRTQDYNINSQIQITLTRSYPAGTIILALQFEPTSGSVQAVGNQNPRIIDGRFDFWFESTSQSTSGYGSCTMWRNEHVGSIKTTSRELLTVGVDIPEVPTAKFYSSTSIASSAGASNFVRQVQRIEDVRTYAGKAITISLYVRTEVNREIAVNLVQDFGDDQPTQTIVDGQKQATTTEFQRLSFTFDVPSIEGKDIGTDSYLELRIWFDAGSDFDAQTDSLGQQPGLFDVACVQDDIGLLAGDFLEFEPRQALEKTKRYFVRRDITSLSSLNIFYTGTQDDEDEFRFVQFFNPEFRSIDITFTFSDLLDFRVNFQGGGAQLDRLRIIDELLTSCVVEARTVTDFTVERSAAVLESERSDAFLQFDARL